MYNNINKKLCNMYLFSIFVKKIIMKKIMLFWGNYYPIVLAFISFLFSVSLWFYGYKLEGIFVGIWVPSILCFYTVITMINKNLGA